jgi:hypothetical protein
MRGLRDCSSNNVFETATIEYQGATNTVLRNDQISYNWINNVTGMVSELIDVLKHFFSFLILIFLIPKQDLQRSFMSV